jgi:ankyrin repeat protein
MRHSRVTSNEDIVRWYLCHGADPNARSDCGSTPMTFAAREASLSTMKLLVEHGGQVCGTDLIAQAAIGHSWGRKNRIEVIEWLLDLGASIDAMSASTWKSRQDFRGESAFNDFMLRNLGGRTALNVANLSGDAPLAAFLIGKGANGEIQPVNQRLVEEFVYIGGYYADSDY